MSDPIQEGQAFVAAVFGKGPAKEPEQPTTDGSAEPEPPVEDAPVEDGLITVLRQHKQEQLWAAEFVRLLHPPLDAEKEKP